MSTLISASRFLSLQPVVRSRKFCAALSLLLTALFALLALPAAQAQMVESGAVAIAPSISTAAGNGTAGYNGNSVPTSAELNSPTGVTLDSMGNLYIADYMGARVLMVAAETGTVLGQSVTAGGIYTVAGNGTASYSGDGGAAVIAELNFPSGVALDSAGNLYIADSGNQRIRMVTASTGKISTVAGNGTQGSGGDGGLATSAQLSSPTGVAVDRVGDIYIGDTFNNRVREVNAAGIITTVAGTGTAGFSGDDIAATSAELNNPAGVTLDHAGNLYIADTLNQRIRVVAAAAGTVLGVSVAAGDIYTVAGNGTPGYNGDGGLATGAELSNPSDVALDSVGNLYIADFNNQRIRMVAATTGVTDGQSVTADDIYTVAGDGTAGYTGDGGLATAAELNNPTGVAVGKDKLYIGDTSNERVREVSANTTLPPTAVGASPSAQNIFVELTTGGAVSGVIVPPAQNGKQEFTVGPITGCTPGSTIYPAGTICTISITFSPQYPGQRTGELTLNGSSGPVGTVGLVGIGSAPEVTGYPGALAVVPTGSTKLVVAVAGVAVDGAGNLYIADSGNNVYEVSSTTGSVTTVAGSTGGAGNVTTNPQPATSAVISPVGVAVDAAGNVYIADADQPGALEGVSAATGDIEIIAGGGSAVPSTTPQPAMSVKLINVVAPAVDGAGNVYITDQGRGEIDRINPAGELVVVAGGGNATPSTSLQPATNVKLSGPVDVAADDMGNLYIADLGTDCVVEQVNPAGELKIVAGGLGGSGTSPSPTPQPSASVALQNPESVAVDGAGNLYVADKNATGTSGTSMILQVTGLSTANPQLMTVAGGGSTAPSATATSATTVKLPGSLGVAVDGAGNIYIADGNTMVEKVTPAPLPITFPSTAFGSTSPSQPIVVANIGNQTLNFTSIAVTTNFSDTNTTCSNSPTLSSGAICTVDLQFAPTTGSAGTLTGTLSLTDNDMNASGAVQSVNLSGAATGTPMPQAATPTFSPGTGTYTSTQSVTISSTTSGAVIHCAINATATASSPVCTSVTVSTSETISAVATASGYTTSAVGSATYTISTGTPAAATPAFSPAGGTYTSTQTVTISSTTSGATIYYTTNGATPTTSSTPYTGPITVSSSETINAIATASGYTQSAVGTAAYTITGPTGSYTLAANPNTMTIAPGATGSTVLTLATTNYNGAVTLSCSGLPANAYCSFPQNAGAQSQAVTLTGSNMNVNLNIETSVATAPPLTLMQGMPSPFGPQSPLSPILPALAFWWPGGMAGLAAFGRKRGLSRTQQRMLQLCLLVLMTGALAAGISGCGGSSSSTPAAHSTPAGTFSVTVTATPASGTPQTTTITLTIS